jgi:hypothetical protein
LRAHLIARDTARDTRRNAMPEMLDALRTAAAALLTAAPEPVVRRMLRELLAEDPAPANALGAPPSGNSLVAIQPRMPVSMRPETARIRR